MLDTDKLKELVGLDDEDTSKDAVLAFALEGAEEIILNYCNLSTLPSGLQHTAYRMAMDLYRNENPGEDADGRSGPVSSVVEGNVTVSFSGNATSAQLYASSLCKQYEKTLNRYRRLRWK